ncbi:phosphatase PAP2 family protein [Hoeflea sp.]|uniref:phosphatase PAP2 family protein n=1 Tax=Hoeflea sp. TaxID=1940281 RepID=UPI003B5273C7
MTRETGILRLLMIRSLVASTIIVALLLALSKLSLDLSSFGLTAGLIALLVVAAVYYRGRGLSKVALIMEVMACGIGFSVLVLISTYLAVSVNAPLADEALAAMDRTIGFDGVAFIRLIDGMPLLSWALMQSYVSFALQLMILPVLLVLFDRAASACALVLSYAIVCAIASIVSVWFPALGSHVVYDIDPASLQSVNAYFGHAFLSEFHGVRESAAFTVSLDRAEGILTFPSVHAAVALLCAACAWSVTLLRYPFLLLNVLMATATLTHGAHYLIDTIAGLALAVVVLAAVFGLSRAPAVLSTQVRPRLGGEPHA